MEFLEDMGQTIMTKARYIFISQAPNTSPMSQQFHISFSGSGKGKGKGLIGLIGLLGLKGLLPKAFSILSALFPLILLLAVPLVVINLPMILPLALPLLLPLLLPVLLPVIALAALFVPIPVIATGRRNFLEQKREEFSRAIHNVIHEDQCIERISCQISNAAKKYGISYEPIKR